MAAKAKLLIGSARAQRSYLPSSRSSDLQSIEKFRPLPYFTKLQALMHLIHDIFAVNKEAIGSIMLTKGLKLKQTMKTLDKAESSIILAFLKRTSPSSLGAAKLAIHGRSEQRSTDARLLVATSAKGDALVYSSMQLFRGLDGAIDPVITGAVSSGSDQLTPKELLVALGGFDGSFGIEKYLAKSTYYRTVSDQAQRGLHLEVRLTKSLVVTRDNIFGIIAHNAVQTARALVPGDFAKRQAVACDTSRLFREIYAIEDFVNAAANRQDIPGLAEGLRQYRASCLEFAAAIERDIRLERRLVRDYIGDH